MIRNVLLSLLFVFIGTIAYGQTTSLSGKLTDADTGEPVMFANVAIYKNGVLITGVETDLDGNYNFSNIDSGTYDIESSFIGYATIRLSDVKVFSGQANIVDLTISEGGGVNLDEVVVIEYKEPLIKQDNTTQGAIVTAAEIKNLPTRSINGLAATSAGVGASDDGEDLNIRGGRSDATVYFIDGIQVRGNLIPESEIDQLQVITGGVDASYGDVVGGVISITTKGPSAKFGGGIEFETSEPFDNYGYNLIRGNVSGPILKKKFEDGTERSILGFRVSGQYRRQDDDDPPALPIYVAKDDVIANLEANPVQATPGGGFEATATDITAEDVNELDFRPNELNERIDLTAKLDARLTDKIDVTLSGTFNNEDDLFTPGYGSTTTASNRGNNAAWRGTWTTFNSNNNPIDSDQRIRGNFRFRHRLSGDPVNQADGDVKPSVIQNASYVLQLGYERQFREVGDSRHGDNFFNYGHIGQFDFDYVPSFGDSEYTGGIPNPFPPFVNTAHTDYAETFAGYTPGTTNPVLANYNNLVVDPTAETDFLAINGEFNGTVRDSWNFHENVGSVYNSYFKRENEFITFNVNSNFDIVPGGKSENGRHSIQFGIRYEQRFNRGYSISPRALWPTGRQLSNRHLTSVDTLNVLETIIDEDGTITGVPGAELEIFSPIVNLDNTEGSYFFRRARELTGTPIDQFFNIDALDPSLLSLDLFSAQELNDQTLLNLNYYGFNYKGERISNSVTFDDFFTSVDENGVRDLPVAAFQPIYSAAYIQDKFRFKDIIFSVGLRVERYDANTKVLKDPFSLYTVMTADQFYSENPDLIRPESVGDDFKVYVDGDGERSTAVSAFRDGETWFFADGEQANGGNVVFGGEVVQPRLISENVNNIRSNEFDVDNSFTDYEPELNWMPRLAFSFPISDDANFFAHYDILVQRPSAGQALTTPLQYYYFLERGQSALLENPNLRPQKKIDYEVGFQQKLNRISAIKISAFYNELRDLIQRRTYTFVADIGAYTSFDNQDFGTVKGFSFEYDLRRTNNVQLNATYTLQFADGTGSDADSQAGLTTRGNLRTLFPFNYDERHRLNLTIDYRYGSGKKYNGPTLGGMDIFANAGININGTAVSGRPYTRTLEAQVLSGLGRIGSLNGARLPWNYWLNVKIDKQFRLTKPEARTQLGLNVYLRIQNILDRRNIISVYTATGSPEDDGFLVTNEGQDAIRSITNNNQNIGAYLDQYEWRRINPNFYSLPRRIYLGAALNF